MRTSARTFIKISEEQATAIAHRVYARDLASAGAFRQVNLTYNTHEGTLEVWVRGADKIFAKYGDHTLFLLCLETGQWYPEIERAAFDLYKLRSRWVYNSILEQEHSDDILFYKVRFGIS